jgi:2-iminobutanoate/2-iminopropanoate deaminase
MPKQVIRPSTVHATTGYSHAWKSGNTVYISGQVSQDKDGNVVGKGDIAAQAAQVLSNLKNVVEAAGGTMHDIVKITVFTLDLAYRPAIADARTKYWQSDWPASTFLVISSLASPDYLLEIEAIAVIE